MAKELEGSMKNISRSLLKEIPHVCETLPDLATVFLTCRA